MAIVMFTMVTLFRVTPQKERRANRKKSTRITQIRTNSEIGRLAVKIIRMTKTAIKARLTVRVTSLLKTT